MVILIFERSAEISRRLTDFIKETILNSEVYQANDYAEAVRLLQQVEARAIVLDSNFPGQQSLELLRSIKKMNPETVVFMMYTYVDETILNHYRDIGVDYLFNKYDDFEKIPAIIIAIQEREGKSGKEFNL